MTKQEGLRLGRRALWLFICVAIPCSAWGLPDRFVFQPGEPIRASEINGSFETLWAGVEALEDTTSALEDAVSALEDAVSALEDAVSAVQSQPSEPPTGTIVAFAGRPGAVPAGWLPCDGRGLARDEHPALWDALETAWGDGSESCEGSCDFNLPDLRGTFLRGADLGAGRDPDSADRVRLQAGGNQGDAVGSYQADELAAHSHFTFAAAPSNVAAGGNNDFINKTVPPIESTSSTGGSETRPKNASVLYIIKL